MGGLFGLILLCVLVGGGIKLGTDIILSLFMKKEGLYHGNQEKVSGNLKGKAAG